MSCITVENLTIGHEKHVVLKDLNFTINEGDYFCIIGANGIGKSTLVKTLLNLIPSISGTISLNDGIDFKDIGYLPQKNDSQSDFPASVMEVVLSGFLNQLGLRPFYNKKEKKLALEQLSKLGIQDLSNKSFSSLSGGQQQRVLLARALCATSKILLLDEPCASLDVESEIELHRIISKLNHDGTTIIMITHDHDFVKDNANKILEITKEGFTLYNKDEFDKYQLKRGGYCDCNH